MRRPGRPERGGEKLDLAAGVPACRRRVCPAPPRTPRGELKSQRLPQAGPPAPARRTCSKVRRRNSWDSSSGCSNSSESGQLRPPTSPAIIVARRPRPATHKAPRGSVPEVTSRPARRPRVCRHSGCAVTLAAPLVPFRLSGSAGAPNGVSPGNTPGGERSERSFCRGNDWRFQSGGKRGKGEVHGAAHHWRPVAPPVTSGAETNGSPRMASREDGAGETLSQVWRGERLGFLLLTVLLFLNLPSIWCKARGFNYLKPHRLAHSRHSSIYSLK